MSKYRNSGNRPWWWWVNPWLYIARRDHYYEEALDIIADIESKPPDTFEPNRIRELMAVEGWCKACNRKYVKRLIEVKQ